MRKYIFIFILVFVGVGIYFSSSFTPKQGFVSIHDKKFQLDGKDFYPVAINYCTSLQADTGEIWVCPSFDYNANNRARYFTKDSNLLQLKAHMDIIKEMGFNSIRIVGAGVPKIDSASGGLYINARIDNRRDTSFMLSDEKNYKKYFNALAEMFDVINKAGLKVIFLIRVNPDFKSTEVHLAKIALRFKNDTTIMAYDLFNEPLYFDKHDRDKQDVYETSRRWGKIFKWCSPNQLTTIGLAGLREVFAWDPNILNVDFVSFHPYEYEPEQVRNEMYWYYTYVKKPWMLGETSLPSDNDSVSYEEQKIFAHKTLMQNYNCGAIGYSWWQYKDVSWNSFHQNFMGVVNRVGETKTKKENIIIDGTPKPVVEEFKKFEPPAQKENCLCLSNYYNYSNYKDFRIKGHVSDENNKPVQGAVILAWDEYWIHPFHTITKADGSFEVTGNCSFSHWMVSATLHTMVRGEISPSDAKTSIDRIPTIDIGNIKIKKLSFL